VDVLATHGAVYIAFGGEFVAEAVHSARSLQRHSPGLSSILFKDKTSGWDQATLRVAAWQSDARIMVLPPEFNIRLEGVKRRVRKSVKNGSNPGCMEPRILHWHGLHAPRWYHRFSPKYRACKY
jgi:hypothetical protein